MEDTAADQLSPTKMVRSSLVEKMEVALPTKDYKSFGLFMGVAVILAISSFQFGYALCEISTVNILTLKQTFSIQMDTGLANGILVGIMPVGGIFGCLLNRLFLEWFSRKNTHYVVSALNLISTALNQITTPYTIIIGRFILGVCCGLYTAIAPQYIKQISPFSLRPLFGSLFSMGRIIGIVFCYGLGLILQLNNVEGYWRIMFAIPGGLALLQSVLIFFFVPDSPVEMLQKKQDQKFQEYVQQYYLEEYYEKVIRDYKNEQELQQSSLEKNAQEESADDPLKQNKRRAFIMVIHLNIYRQMIGANTILAFAGQMVQSVDQSIAPYVNTILNSFQLIATAISTFWLGTKFGRRPLFLVSGILFGLSCYLVFIGYLINVEALILAFMLLYVIIFGLLYAPVSWAYPSEIMPPDLATIAISFTWVSLAITTIFPPIVMEKMNQNAWPIFLYFAVYITISLIYMGIKLVESKGRQYKEIIERY